MRAERGAPERASGAATGWGFGILGPLQVSAATGDLPVPPGRQQVVLGALLLEVNHIVSFDYLVDAIWGEEPPETARTQVQICVSRLRRRLNEKDGAFSIETRSPGYRINLTDAQLDLTSYRRLVEEADRAVAGRRPEEAATLFRSALSLWRGPALSGIASPTLQSKAARLDEDRMTVVEKSFSTEMALGRHHQVIGELQQQVKAYPYREWLRAQLMLALYRSGRQVEALDCFRAGRDLLIDELGLEPGEELRGMEHAILSNDTALSPGAASVQSIAQTLTGELEAPGAVERSPESSGQVSPVPAEAPAGARTPRQLPTDTGDFVGRPEVLASLREALLGGDEHKAVGSAVIVGGPGAGKSAVAIRLAHQLADEHFPQGQLYCNMRGTSADPATPGEALSRFLRAFGVQGSAIPDATDERAEVFRDLLASRRVLLVLDDVASVGQVLPLLPGSGTCAVLVTSRSRLTHLPGNHMTELDVLTDQESLELMEKVVGEERILAEPAAAIALVRTVGRLPLALRIISARLAARPHWSLASMVNRLANENHILDQLSHGDLIMRSSLSLSYDSLPKDERRIFRLLSLTEGLSVPAWTAGALLNDPGPFPADLVEPLVDAQMLDVPGTDINGDPRYRFHDILRLYGRELLETEEPDDERGAAAERLLGGWLSLVDEANRRIFGGDYLMLHGDGRRWPVPAVYTKQALADPLAWLEQERSNLVSAVTLAAEIGLDEICWDLATSLVPFFGRRSFVDDWERTNHQSMELVRRTGNRRGEAALLFSRGALHANRRRYGAAIEDTREALGGFAALGDRLGEAKCRRQLAHLEQTQGDDEAALRLTDEALEGFRAAGDVVGQARSLLLSGHLHGLAGRTAEGRAQLDEALECYRKLGEPRGQAQVLRRIGQMEWHAGGAAAAEGILREAHEIVVGLGDIVGEGFLLRDLGCVATDLGRFEEARRHLGRSLELREQLGDELGAGEARLDLARVLSRTGERELAVELAEIARDALTSAGTPEHVEEAEALLADLRGDEPSPG